MIVFADMTMALIDAANDKTEDGQEMISQALFDLGKHKPALVLSSCYSYLKKHTKVGQISNNVSLCRFDTVHVKILGRVKFCIFN